MKKMNKKLASAIVLGLMLAVPVGVSADDIKIVNDGEVLEGEIGSSISNDNPFIIKGESGSENITFVGDPNEQFL